MVALAGLSRYRATMASFSTLVQSELTGFFGALDLSKPEAVRNALIEFTPLLVEQYGPVGATLAADWYDEQRAESGAPGRFLALPADLELPLDGIESQTRYLAGHLWTPEPEAMLGGLLVQLDKWVRQPARDTIRHNSTLEGVGWARVPRGRKTCSFCLVLASRDATYFSGASAGDKRYGGTEYHGDCHCEAVRMGPGEDYPKDYLPAEYESMYGIAVDEAATDPEVQAFMDTLDPKDRNRELKGVTFAMRRNFPGDVNDGVTPKTPAA